ncbi:unnamed protein product [Protopolystoma xenopodis]|uniref:Uncharacterized protein n=1 Tax=Protopolystoma xenopodis TaxID=117903 RepID=A0A448WCD4_9PLAT|nr:unnamed protein product [Protopolystoma xenopodis]
MEMNIGELLIDLQKIEVPSHDLVAQISETNVCEPFVESNTVTPYDKTSPPNDPSTSNHLSSSNDKVNDTEVSCKSGYHVAVEETTVVPSQVSGVTILNESKYSFNYERERSLYPAISENEWTRSFATFQQPKVASAPEISNDKAVSSSIAYELPELFKGVHLKNIYLNKTLDEVDEIESSFLRNCLEDLSDPGILTPICSLESTDVEASRNDSYECSVVLQSSSSTPPISQHPLYALIFDYALLRSKWYKTVVRFLHVTEELAKLEQSVWLLKNAYGKTEVLLS